jgi:putative transposase
LHMPRLPRFYIPGLPLHVIQRGNDRAMVFKTADDWRFYRRCVVYASRRHGVAIHAYVLMTNHVHLLATPSRRAGIPKMMQSIGRVYVTYFNRRYSRTGTLWEGRYKATIIEDETYLLACMRYIELNPVRAGMVTSPAQYPWSSYHANASGRQDGVLQAHETYRRLGRSPVERRTAYRALFADAIPDESLRAIRDATQNAWALGGSTFRHNVTLLSRRAERTHRGRAPAHRRRADSDPN